MQEHLQKHTKNLSSHVTSAKPKSCLGPNSEKPYVLWNVRRNPLKHYWSWQYYSCAPSHTCTLAEQELQIQHTAATPSPAQAILSWHFTNEYRKHSQLHIQGKIWEQQTKTDQSTACKQKIVLFLSFPISKSANTGQHFQGSLFIEEEEILPCASMH